MARIKRNTLQKICRLLLAGARKGLLPSGLVFGLLGLLASRLTASNSPPITCYVPAPEYRGPITKSIYAFPNPTGGAKTVRVVATLVGYSEGQVISGANLFARTESHKEVPGFGPKPMKPKDGSFDSDSEDVYVDLNVSGWAEGDYWIYVSGYNQAGEEGVSGALNLQITKGE